MEFGDYEVNITVPSDHIVEATGSLLNPKDVLNKEEYKRFIASENNFEEPILIVNQEEAIAKESLFSKKKNDGKIARMYHDHGHKNIPDLPRGLDRAGLIGFNYRMTEISGAFGKVQLGKFSGILKESKNLYIMKR